MTPKEQKGGRGQEGGGGGGRGGGREEEGREGEKFFYKTCIYKWFS